MTRLQTLVVPVLASILLAVSADPAAGLFGTRDLTWTVTTGQAAVPHVVQAQRTNSNLKQVMKEIDDTRDWAGLHWRNSMSDGGKPGAHTGTRRSKGETS